MSDIVYADQELLYLENTSTEVSYTADEPYQVHVGGGSGTGALHFSVENSTGSGTINSSGVFTFGSYGNVYVKIYKDGSDFNQWEDGTPVNGRYYQSKTLVVELELTRTQVKITVVPDMTYNIGDTRPFSPTSSYTVSIEGTPPGEILSRTPVIYFVNDAANYYKTDIFHYVYEDTRLEGGIIYKRNPDGSWTVNGESTGSYYNLIVSTLGLPRYLVPNREYQIGKIGYTVRLVLEWYRDGKVISTDTVTATQLVTVPLRATGIRMRFYIPEGTVVENETFEYHMYDNVERSINPTKVSKYPISARRATVANEGYDPTIKYRSAWLKFVNIKKYKIFVDYTGRGNITSSYSSATPYTMVLLTVKSRVDSYYEDGWENKYTPTSSSSVTEYDSWWVDVTEYEGTSITNEITAGQRPEIFLDSNPAGLIIYDEDGDVVPFHAIDGSRDEDLDDRLLTCKYIFIMPLKNVRILGAFASISESDGSGNYGSYPYDDVGYGSSYPIELVDKRYRDALMFCYYARQYYFNESNTPLMQGVGSRQFYSTYDGSQYSSTTNPKRYSTVHYIARRDLVEVLRRASHILDFQNEEAWTDWYVDRNPDGYEKSKGQATNTPLHHLYTFQGYPPGLVYGKDASGNDLTLPYPMEYTPFPSYSSYASTGNISKFFSPAADIYAYSGGGANDDYKLSGRYMNGLAWNTWVGNVTGFDDLSFAPLGFTTFQEAITILWRYAQFRQFDVITHGSPDEIDDSAYAEWAQNGPLRWAVTKGITTGYRVPMIENGSEVYLYEKINPTDYIDRVEWAYMIYKFCQLYAW